MAEGRYFGLSITKGDIRTPAHTSAPGKATGLLAVGCSDHRYLHMQRLILEATDSPHTGRARPATATGQKTWTWMVCSVLSVHGDGKSGNSMPFLILFPAQKAWHGMAWHFLMEIDASHFWIWLEETRRPLESLSSPLVFGSPRSRFGGEIGAALQQRWLGLMMVCRASRMGTRIGLGYSRRWVVVIDGFVSR